jgi:hypothetical protein
MATNTKTPAQAATTNVLIGTGKCACSCGEPVSKTSNFRPGHDARLVSQLLRDLHAEDLDGPVPDDEVTRALALLPSAALRAKFARGVQNLNARTAAAAAKAVTK